MDGPCIVGPFCDTYLQSYPHDEAVLGFQGASAGSYSMNSQPALIEPVTVLIDPLFNRSGSDVSSNTVDNLGLCDSLLWQPQQQQTTDQRMGGTWVSADCLGEDIPLLPPMGPLLTDLRSDPDLSVTVSNTSAAQHQHALKPGISELVAAAQSGPIIPYREPPCVPEPSAAPAADQLGLDSSICSSCSKLLDKGEELADSILAGSAGRVALNERIGEQGSAKELGQQHADVLADWGQPTAQWVPHAALLLVTTEQLGVSKACTGGWGVCMCDSLSTTRKLLIVTVGVLE